MNDLTGNIEILKQSPYIAMILALCYIVFVLWKENKSKDTKIYDLAEHSVKIASIYESRMQDVKSQNEKNSNQHAEIIELLRDVKRIIKPD